MLINGWKESLVAAGRDRNRWLSTMSSNQIQMESKLHIQYKHNDNLTRWTSRECHEFMYLRPWQQVINFYSDLVNGRLSLSSIMSGDEKPLSLEKCDPVLVKSGEANESASVSSINRSGRWERVTFKILLSYHGNAFDGWQKQPALNSVQGAVESSVGRFVDEEKAQKLKDKCLPVEGCVHVAGRTDKGVTALEQVCSFYTWRKDINSKDVEAAINEAAPGKLRVISVLKVSREFHPNFSAKWRRYFYIFPLSEEDELCSKLVIEDGNCDNIKLHQKFISGSDSRFTFDDGIESRNEITRKSFSIQKVNQLLLQLQGKSLSYRMFARDTKASRSMGPPTECIIYHVRATEATLPCDTQVPGEGGKRLKVMCIELVGNRFLRRMVRVLVSTSIREAAAGAETDALLKLMDATCRRATAPPAPPEGLCLVDVGYEKFDSKNCVIP